MKIAGAEITLNRSSRFLIESNDEVIYSFIQVKNSDPGVDHPIVIHSGARFRANRVVSEIPSPILCDANTGRDFLGVRDNYIEVK